MALPACFCRWNRQTDKLVIAISTPRHSRANVNGLPSWSPAPSSWWTLDNQGSRVRDGRSSGSPGLGRSQRGAVDGEDVCLAHDGELMESARANPVFIGNGQGGTSRPERRRGAAMSRVGTVAKDRLCSHSRHDGIGHRFVRTGIATAAGAAVPSTERIARIHTAARAGDIQLAIPDVAEIHVIWSEEDSRLDPGVCSVQMMLDAGTRLAIH